MSEEYVEFSLEAIEKIRDIMTNENWVHKIITTEKESIEYGFPIGSWIRILKK